MYNDSMNEEPETIVKDSLNEVTEFLNGLIWHDSVLHEIRFVRTNSADQVVLILDLLDDWERQISRHAEIIFQNCWMVQCQMNWGVKCISEGEMVYGAKCSESGSLIERVKEDWKGINVDMKALSEFKLDMASTSSTLEIVFGGIILKYLSESDTHNTPPPLPIKTS